MKEMTSFYGFLIGLEMASSYPALENRTTLPGPFFKSRSGSILESGEALIAQDRKSVV